FFGMFAGGLAYNPADSAFGGNYTLTTREGLVYTIDGDSGALEQVTDQNGNTLTYTDGGIASSTGVSVSFGRDAAGRITSVTDPNGATVQYTYDANGDLVAVTDRTGVTTRFEYNAARPHFLNRITDPLGRSGTRVEYDQDGRVSRTIDPEG